MKKRDQGPEARKRRLVLNRETIKTLDEPALLGLARGGLVFSGGCGPTKTGPYNEEEGTV